MWYTVSMKYDKLVRDRIPDIISSKGEMYRIHTADDTEYERMLFEKLREETEELICDKTIDEVADVLEVIDAIASFKGFSRESVDRAKQKKYEERGGFSKRIILEEA